MLSIGEFSKICSVTTKTLRYYDEIGLIKPIHINYENGYRFYDISQLKTMLTIDRRHKPIHARRCRQFLRGRI